MYRPPHLICRLSSMHTLWHYNNIFGIVRSLIFNFGGLRCYRYKFLENHEFESTNLKLLWSLHKISIDESAMNPFHTTVFETKMWQPQDFRRYFFILAAHNFSDYVRRVLILNPTPRSWFLVFPAPETARNVHGNLNLTDLNLKKILPPTFWQVFLIRFLCLRYVMS